jgi:hypothetical protein
VVDDFGTNDFLNSSGKQRKIGTAATKIGSEHKRNIIASQQNYNGPNDKGSN